MNFFRLPLLVLLSSVASHALTDSTIFDTTPPPPPPHPRVEAPFVVGVEMGINSLGSLVGGRFTWYPFQQVALDLGGGWSAAGMRGGVGARYFLCRKFNAPFVGVSWMRSGGVDSARLDDGKDGAHQFEVEIKNIQWINALVGYEIRRVDGLTLGFTTGWSFALTSKKDRSQTKCGTLSNDAKDWLDFATGSGPVATLTVGYGF